MFPDHVKFMTDLHDRDLKITLNTHPGDGIRSFEESYERMCKKLNRDPTIGDVCILECRRLMFRLFCLTQPTESSWKRTLLKYIIPLKMRVSTFGGSIGSRVILPVPRVLIPCGMLNHYHFMDSKRRLERRMTFSRFAGPGNQRYPVGFSGVSLLCTHECF